MARYTDWIRDRSQSPAARAIAQGEGRKLLGALMERLKLGGLTQGVQRRTLPDGTLIEARYDGTTPSVEVIAPVPETVEAAPSPRSVWIPRGFVLYPISDDSLTGWGWPVVPSAEIGVGPYDTENLAPGLAVSRWTAGGKAGQVLLSRAVDANYPPPEDTTSPMLFTATARLDEDSLLWDTPVMTGDYAAYRTEFVAPPAGDRRVAFEAINAHRVSIDLGALAMLPRGWYSGAQASATMMVATGDYGHYSAQFALGMRTPGDRINKNGVPGQVIPASADDRNNVTSSGEILAATYYSATDAGTDPNGYPILHLPQGGPPIDAATAMAQWESSPPHWAIVELPDWDTRATFLDMGFSANVAAGHFVALDDWVAAGNQCWQSSNEAIPALSWHAPGSLNLAYETWPVVARFLTNPFFTPTDPSQIFSAYFHLITPSDGNFWLRHTNERGDIVPVWQNRIFCRGRCIAIAPRGGIVWAAAIIERGATYRLVALVHHATDQVPEGTADAVDYMMRNGATPYVRVWWCDIPDVSGFVANPSSVIRGVYGAENPDEWPWLETEYRWSWRDAGTVNVRDGMFTADLLKYASQWRFSADGTRAVCLRDQMTGAFSDWRSMFVPIQAGSVTALGAPGYVHMAGHVAAAMVELRFVHSDEGVTVHRDVTPIIENRAEDYGIGFSGWYNSFWVRTSNLDPFPEDEQDDDPEDICFLRMIPVAADYVGDDTEPTVAFRVHTAPGGTPYFAYGNFVVDTYYGGAEMVAFGRYADDWSAVRDTAVLVANNRSDAVAGGGTITTMPDLPQVLDIADRVVLYTGPETWDSGQCWSALAARTTLYRDGVAILTRDFTIAYPLMWNWNVFCAGAWVLEESVGAVGAQMQLDIERMAQATYARNRAGEWVATFQLRPQWIGLIRVVEDIGGPFCRSPEGACQRPTTFSEFRWMDEDDDAHYGGAWNASFADSAALAAMTETPGVNPSSLYARVV